MKQKMSIEELEKLMAKKQKDMPEQEFSEYVGSFWDYFHIAYCF